MVIFYSYVSLQEGISHELPPKIIDGLRFFGPGSSPGRRQLSHRKATFDDFPRKR